MDEWSPFISPILESERPSFEDLTLSQLCEWIIKRHYGLTTKEIKQLIEAPLTPDRIPAHHQVDPRIIKAYLTGESVPNFLPREVDNTVPASGPPTIPSYLPRDRFSPTDLVVPLVNDRYRVYYHWRNSKLEEIATATELLVGYLETGNDITGQIHRQPCLSAALLRWKDGYYKTYYCINDSVLLEGHYLKPRHSRLPKFISWYAGKSAKEIYATALAIFQEGRLIPHTRPTTAPDFTSLTRGQQEQIFERATEQTIYSPYPLSSGYTGIATYPGGLPDEIHVIAEVSKFHVIYSHAYVNFPSIDDLRQEILDRHTAIGIRSQLTTIYRTSRTPQPPPIDAQRVQYDSSWEGGGPIHLELIPPDVTIEENYRHFRATVNLNRLDY